MKNGSFVKHFLSLGIGTFAYMLVGTLGTPILTRLVDPAIYGDYSIFIVYSNLGLTICLLGLDQAFVRFFYSHDSVQYRSRLLYKCMIPGMIAVMLLAITVWPVTIQRTMFSSIELIAVAVNVVLLIVFRYTTLCARLTYQTNLFSIITIIQKSLFLLLSIGLILSCIWTHIYLILIISTMLSTVVASLVGIGKEKPLWKNSSDANDMSSIAYADLFRFGFPLLFSAGITSLMNALDKLALDRFCTRSDVGIYTSAMNLLAVFSVIRTSFNALWIPSAVEAFEKGENYKSYFQRGNAFITMLMLLFGAGMIMCKDLFVILLGEEYRSAALIFPFLMFEPIMYTISETTVTGLVVTKKSGYQIIAAITACMTNFMGNWLLTPRMGPQGAAISTGFSYVVFFAMRTILANRVCYIDYSLPKLTFMSALLAVYAVYGSITVFSVYQVFIFVLYSVILLLVYRKESALAFQYVKCFINKRR